MKIVCTQENLKTGITSVTRIISNSLSLPVLNTILLKTEAGQLKISANNLEVGINTFIRCKTEIEGSICVPAKVFQELVNSLPNSNITLQTKDNDLLVETDSVKAKIKTISPDEFPIIPTPEDGDVVEIEAETLKQALDQTVFATAVGSMAGSAVISGVLLAFEGKGMKVVATDRYRLAEKSIHLDSEVKPRKVIVPQKTAQEVIRVIGSSEEKGRIQITTNETQILFKYNQTEISGRLIEGEFPEYQQIILDTFNTVLQVDRHELSSALKTVSVFSENTYGIRFSYDEKLEINAVSEMFGEGMVSVACKIEGAAGKVIFNYKQIQDLLGVIQTEKIEIKLLNDSSVVMFTPLGTTDYLYLVKPLQI